MTQTCIIAASSYELLRSLKRTLEPDLEVVAMVDNLVSWRDAMLALRPDLVVGDIELLGRSPGKLVRVLRSRSAEVRLILLAAGDDPRVEHEARKAGVDRIMMRSLAGSELVSVALEVLGARQAVERASESRAPDAVKPEFR